MDFSITHAIVDYGFSHADRHCVFMQRLLKLNDYLKLIFKPSSTQIQIIRLNLLYWNVVFHPVAFKTNVLKPSFVKAVVLNEVLCNFIINS